MDGGDEGEIPLPQSPQELDAAVAAIGSFVQEESRLGQLIVENFLNDPNSYQLTFDILNSNCSSSSKFYALKALYEAVKVRWRIFDPETCTSILESLKFYFNKLSQDNSLQAQVSETIKIFVEIAKYEWPQNLPDFLNDFINEAQNSEQACMNAFQLISYLATEIGEEADDSLTSLRAQEMNNALISHFPNIFQLIQQSLGVNVNRTQVALTALKKLLRLPDINSYLQPEWVQSLVEEYLPQEGLTIPVIGVLADIVARPIGGQDVGIILQLFDTLIFHLKQIIGDQFDVTNNVFDQLNQFDDFADGFVRAITSFFNSYFTDLETTNHTEQIEQVLKWIGYLTIRATKNNFENCVKFWMALLRKIMISHFQKSEISQIYSEYFHLVRVILIEKMPKPISIIPYLDDDGLEHKRIHNNTNYGTFYSETRDCLVFLTNIDQNDMLSVFEERLTELQTQAIDINSACSVCWAIGAVAGALTPDTEDSFFPMTIDVLLKLCYQLTDLSEKTKLAEGIVFVFSQFHKFLNRFPQVLKVVVSKIIEFMKESNAEELQEYSLEALKTISLRCKMQIINPIDDDVSILINFLDNISELIEPLLADNIPTLFEILSILIQGIRNEDIKKETAQRIINELTSRFLALIQAYDANNLEINQQLIIILKSLSTIPVYLGPYFINQISEFIGNMTEFYQLLTTTINEYDGDPSIYLIVKDALLTVIQKSIYFCHKTENIQDIIFPISMKYFMPDYLENPKARIPSVLTLFASILMRVNIDIDPVFTQLIQPTLQMIDPNDPTVNSEFFLSLFTLINNLSKTIYSNSLEVPIDYFDVIIDTLKFGCQLQHSETRDYCITTLNEIFRGMNDSMAMPLSIDFIEKYSMNVLFFAFEQFFNISYKSSFQNYVELLRFLLSLQTVMHRAGEIAEFICTLLPNIEAPQIIDCINAMYMQLTDIFNFRVAMRNLLVSSRTISVRDPDLNKMEKERMISELREEFKSIPGFAPPEDEQELGGSNLPSEILSLSVK